MTISSESSKIQFTFSLIFGIRVLCCCKWSLTCPNFKFADGQNSRLPQVDSYISAKDWCKLYVSSLSSTKCSRYWCSQSEAGSIICCLIKWVSNHDVKISQSVSWKGSNTEMLRTKQVLWTEFTCKFGGATKHLPQQSSLFVSVTSDTATASSRSTTSHPGSKTFGSVWLQVFRFQMGLASPSTALEAAPPAALVVLWYAGLPSARLQPGKAHWHLRLSFWYSKLASL